MSTTRSRVITTIWVGDHADITATPGVSGNPDQHVAVHLYEFGVDTDLPVIYLTEKAATTLRDALNRAIPVEDAVLAIDVEVPGSPGALVAVADSAEKFCPSCGGRNGSHGLVHVRHDNGGGHNEPCPSPAPLVAVAE